MSICQDISKKTSHRKLDLLGIPYWYYCRFWPKTINWKCDFNKAIFQLFVTFHWTLMSEISIAQKPAGHQQGITTFCGHTIPQSLSRCSEDCSPRSKVLLAEIRYNPFLWVDHHNAQKSSKLVFRLENFIFRHQVLGWTPSTESAFFTVTILSFTWFSQKLIQLNALSGSNP